VYQIAHPYTRLKIATGIINTSMEQLHEVQNIRVHPGFSEKDIWKNNVAVITVNIVVRIIATGNCLFKLKKAPVYNFFLKIPFHADARRYIFSATSLDQH